MGTYPKKVGVKAPIKLYKSPFFPDKPWRQNPRCKECVYGANGQYNGCDYFIVTGKTRYEIVKRFEAPEHCSLFYAGQHVNKQRNIDRMMFGCLVPEEAMELYNKGYCDREIQEHFGCSKHAVNKWRTMNGLPARHARLIKIKKTPATELIHDQLMEYYNAGLNDIEIGLRIGMSTYTVYEWRKRHGLDNKLQIARDERNRKYKEAYESGMIDADIARAVGVSETSVQRWRAKYGLKTNQK